MIKREEVRQALENMRADVIDFRDIIDVSSYSSDADYTRIDEYITEQEKKDELLELYREKDNHIENWENYDRSCDMGYIAKFEYLKDKIKALEEEMK